MNEGVRREWSTVLTAAVALTYGWIGVVVEGWDSLWGIAGGVVLLTALVVARHCGAAALALMLVGALPLAIATWWSLLTPLLALLALTALGLGCLAVHTLRTVRLAHHSARPLPG